MNYNVLKILLIICIAVVINPPGISQNEIPEILQKGSLPDQLNYIEERTRIYENYRAIREDMFQKIKKNTLDSLSFAKSGIADLTAEKARLNSTIDSLNKLIEDTRVKLDEAVRTKNRIKVLGIDINKFAYNSVMWIIVVGLAILLITGFLAFKRNVIITRNTRRDLEDIKKEFEAYRKQSREAREKMSMDHFNEIKRLKAQNENLRAQVSPAASPKEESPGNEATDEVKKPRKKGAKSSEQGNQGSAEV